VTLKAMLWDNDGVLVDTEPLFFRATREALVAAGSTRGDIMIHRTRLHRNTTPCRGLRRRARGCLVALLFLSAFSPRWVAAAGSVTLIADSAGLVGLQLQGISGDGHTVVGTDLFQNGFYHTAPSGAVQLPALVPGGNVIAETASEDGSVIVGAAQGAAPWEPFRYTQAGGMVSLGSLTMGASGSAYGVLSDGSVVVGTSDSIAFRWTQAGGLVPLSGAIGGGATAYDVSGDGSVVIGGAFSLPAGIDGGAFRWTTSQGMVNLGTLPGHEYSSAYAISRDASTIVGSSYDEDTDTGEAFRWTQSEGMVGIGRLPGTLSARAWDVSADGGVIIGESFAPGPDETWLPNAFVWTQATGMLSLDDFLSGRGINPARLPFAVSLLSVVSHDGMTLAGVSDDPEDLRSFVIDLAASVAALGVVGQVALIAAMLGGGAVFVCHRATRRRSGPA
jgi:uncharacterized membrane protein